MVRLFVMKYATFAQIPERENEDKLPEQTRFAAGLWFAGGRLNQSSVFNVRE